MKYFFLCFVLIICFSASSIAQLAKMQFEDAETAYNEGKFAEAIKLLDEAERSNKGVNLPIMHLRILSRVELIKKDPEKDFDIIDKARKETDLFLKQYDGNAQLEDKYRDVYKASKLLKELPLTQEAFEESLVKKKEAAAEAERVRKEKLRFFHSYNYVNGFKKGATLDEYRKIYQIRKGSVSKMLNGDRQIYIYGKPSYYVNFRNDEAYGYHVRDGIKAKGFEVAKRLEAEKIAYFNGLFGFEPEVEVQKFVKSTTTGTKFKWKNGDRVFYMETMFYPDSDGSYICGFDYFNFDKQY